MSDQDVKELKAKVDLVEYIGRKVKLEKKGDYHMGRCPFHDDKNPSFSVNADAYKCFACGESGDIFTWLEKQEGLPFREALKRLRGETGSNIVHLPVGGDRDKPASKSKSLQVYQEIPRKPNQSLYPYADQNGEVICVIERVDMPGRKQVRQWSRRDGGWVRKGLPRKRGTNPLYRLGAVLSGNGTVLVVEGEKCVELAERAFPRSTVTTWMGGTNAVQYTDWTPLTGRKLILIADNDDAGRKAMQQVGEIVGNPDLVRVFHVDGEKGDDVEQVIDRMGSDGAIRHIMANLKELEKPAPPQQSDVSSVETVDKRDLLTRNDYYHLLGLIGERVAVRIHAGRTLLRSREAMCSPDTLVAFAPNMFWCNVANIDMLQKTSSRIIGDTLIRIADQLGQVDESRMFGRGAYKTPDGEVGWHLGDRLLVDGKEYDLADSTGGIMQAEPRIEVAQPASDDEVRAAMDAIFSYRFATNKDAMIFTGWLACALAGGALDWRPHILLNAPAGTGKSYLINEVIKPIFGDVCYFISDGTAAAIARLTENSSLPLVIDEAEPDGKWIVETLAYMRIASDSTGQRVRADSGSGVMSQSPRFSALMSSVALPRMTKASASRFMTVNLGDEVADWSAVSDEIQRTLGYGDRLRARIIRDTKLISKRAADHLLETRRLPIDDREAKMIASIIAGFEWWSLGDAKSYDDMSMIMLMNEQDTDVSDSSELIRDILAVPHNVGGGYAKTIRELVWSTFKDDYEMAVENYGIKLHEGRLLIAHQHGGLKRLLSRTQWGETNLKSVLMQFESSESTNPIRLGGYRFRCVSISVEELDKRGFIGRS